MITSMRTTRNLTPRHDDRRLHPTFQPTGADRHKLLNRNPDLGRGTRPTVQNNTPLNSSPIQASPKPFSIFDYSNLFLENWKSRSRFSNHDPRTRLAMLGLAAAFGSHRPDMALTVNLRPGETTADFIGKLTQAVRRAGGRKLTYFGVFSSLRFDKTVKPKRPEFHRHLHLVLSLPTGSAEHAAVQAFLIRREKEYLDGCTQRDGKSPEWHLRRGGGKAEPMKPVHFNCLTDAMRGYNSLPGYTRYLAHHIRDAERSDCPEQHAVEIVASEEISALAREIGRHPPEALGEVIKREGLDLPGLLEIDGPMLARVISKRKPDLPVEKATRRVLEGYIDHIRANRIPVVMPPAVIRPLRL